LRKLRNREVIVGDAVRGARRVEHLQVQHTVDADLHVVFRDADLLGDIERLLLQAVAVGDPLHERNQYMEAGRHRAAVLAEDFDDVRALLRHDDGRLRDDDDGEHRRDDGDDQNLVHCSFLLTSIRRGHSG
jgi:hypothetical protein